jgi:hypothetical protein
MKLHQVEQYTEAWRQLRLGRPTASQFHKIITPTGKPSKQQEDYTCLLIAERLLGEPMEKFAGNAWTQRGHDLQAEAAAAFTNWTGMAIEPGGVAISSCERFAASPDYQIVGRNAALEIKCLAPWNHVSLLLYGQDADYRPQVQGQMLVGEYDAVHFWAYHPACPPVHIVTYPDIPYQESMWTLLDHFARVLDVETERARQLGRWIWQPSED